MAPDSENPDLESIARTAWHTIQQGAEEVTIRVRRADGGIIEISIKARPEKWETFLAAVKNIVKFSNIFNK
ncbi:MAG: hypothetical protein HAW59_05755 [Betaproteobacteria bacterium]|nr:hypothetical protein [Betaproteobacteria bacterium]